MDQYLHLDKTYKIHGYKTKTELEVLEFLAFSSFENDDDYEPAVDNILSECVGNYNPKLSKLEKSVVKISSKHPEMLNKILNKA